MFGRGEHDLRSPRLAGIEDPLVIGGDDHRIDIRAPRTFPHTTQKRFAGNDVQWLAGKSRGTPTRGNDDERLHWAVTPSEPRNLTDVRERVVFIVPIPSLLGASLRSACRRGFVRLQN